MNLDLALEQIWSWGERVRDDARLPHPLSSCKTCWVLQIQPFNETLIISKVVKKWVSKNIQRHDSDARYKPFRN